MLDVVCAHGFFFWFGECLPDSVRPLYNTTAQRLQMEYQLGLG
jgi:hypothetical protein